MEIYFYLYFFKTFLLIFFAGRPLEPGNLMDVTTHIRRKEISTNSPSNQFCFYCSINY